MSIVSLVFTLVARARALASAIAPLAVRVLMGHAFFLAGLGKWRHFEGTVEYFTSLGIPAPGANAAFIATLELVGGIALVLGLGTRVFSALLSSTMVVALLTAERAGLIEALTGGERSPTELVPLVYLAFLTVLFAFGAGPLSVDRLIARPLSRSLARWTGAPATNPIAGGAALT